MTDQPQVPPTTQPQSQVPQPPQASPAPAAPAGEGKPIINYDDFAKLDLRIGKVVSAVPHPNADKLILLQLETGGEPRQIVAGLKPYMTPESLVGKTIVFVANLEPRKMRGIDSNGMLLAAGWTEGDARKVVVLTTDGPVPAGSLVS